MASERKNHAKLVVAGEVRLERRLPGPIERVWSYLVDEDKRAKWFGGGPWPLQPGARGRLIFNHDNLTPHEENIPEEYREDACGGTFDVEVVHCEPPKKLTFRWFEKDGSEFSEVTFELAPEGEDVQLVLTHRLLRDRREEISVSSGWHTHVDLLIDVLEGRTPQPFWEKAIHLEKVYEELYSDK
ncbi:MAG: SRPBCC family protein [Candidatus Sumerlaeia bacterium]|nr:SRPBCC family protein [Candidatus Sumerlaeia bacterium]